MKHRFAIKLIAALAITVGAATSFAQPHPAPVQVSGAWVRATVPGQSGTGAFMQLTASTDLRLVGVSTPAAGVAQVHEMKMAGDTMKMGAIAALALPAGQPVALAPGSYHVMLMDLKQPLVDGASVPLTLRFEDAKGAASALDLSVPVRKTAADVPAAHGAAHRH